MKIVCLADTHGMHNKINVPDGDILIHCGDIVPNEHPVHYMNFARWFEQFPHQYKILVPGNHDLALEDEPKMFRYDKFIVLIDSYIKIKGLQIYGTPYQPHFMDWAFNVYSDKKRIGIFNKMPENLDILITHCPPRGILDKNKQGESCGDNVLAEIVKVKKPKYHIFGHIHHSYGMGKHILIDDNIDKKDIIEYVNCSVLDDDYKLKNKPIVLEI